MPRKGGSTGTLKLSKSKRQRRGRRRGKGGDRRNRKV